MLLCHWLCRNFVNFNISRPKLSSFIKNNISFLFVILVASKINLIVSLTNSKDWIPERYNEFVFGISRHDVTIAYLFVKAFVYKHVFHTINEL